ncbi:PAS domain S-box protein [Flavobacterium sp. GT3R68]|uniref:PAS domain S-box protein n=1 Tax=Flavobacterium sp. GT3R68 TaxID=2594437 RepID=UPI000F8736B5|nr:PAS domain S-box protein [Flavobacterium sp. GT3R68]RTY95871.1 PAS domain S-box protein [Flavobacterium sp. GSN2]TRW93643.1 PAS domain S-box protein [Flavobacterium sp. GT3R68]
MSIRKKSTNELSNPSAISDVERAQNEEYMGHMASIVEFSEDAIYSQSLDGIIKSWNKGAEKMFGYTTKQAVGKPISLLIPKGYLKEERKIFLRISNNETINSYETVRKKKKGEHFFISLTVSPIKDHLGTIIGVSKIARDISASKKAEAELMESNNELAIQNKEKEKRESELIIANKELAYQIEEKKKRADELAVANKELAFQNKEKEKRADELIIANIELAYQIEEKKKKAAELVILNKKLALKNKEKEKKESELIIVNTELAYQIAEKEKAAAELGVVNRKLALQNKETEKRESELIIANKELAFQIEEKKKKGADLVIAHRKLASQNKETEKRESELIIANKELAHQILEKEKLSAELTIINRELADYKYAMDESSIIAITDPKGIIKHVNDNFFKISKYSREELIGQDLRIINSGYHPKDYIRNLWKTMANGEIWKGEFRNKAKDKTFYWEDITVIPFLDGQGKPYQYAAIRFDITERKEAERKLKEHLQVLEYQNTQLNDFCYIISHNLRGPLVNISMLVDYIEDSEDEGEQREMVKKMRPVVNKINETFDELVESLQVKHNLKIKYDKLDLKLYFEKTLTLLEREITSSHAEIHINISETPVVNFPKKYMKSILFNLISNSLKFKSPDQKPIIKINSKRIKDRIVLSITDNGLGIDLKMHKKDVFKIRKVFHEHPDARGFGLFMIKTQIEAMGGKIWVESTPDKGSTFFVEFINQPL